MGKRVKLLIISLMQMAIELKCNKCGQLLICPYCFEAEEEKIHNHIYKQQLFNARERKYLDSIKESRGIMGGGWCYEERNFAHLIKGRFSIEDANAVLNRLHEERKNNPAMVKSIKKKLFSFAKGRKG